MGTVVTEIRSFYSIKEIDESLGEDIEQYRAVAEEYSQWLGSLLRDSENRQEDTEWTKRLAELQKAKPKGKPPTQTKKSKSKKARSPQGDWIQFKDIMLNASEQSQAEILFDAIEQINRKVDQLEKARQSIAELEKSRLGKDITYIAYIRDGVPEKIVLQHRKDQEFQKKFQYIADFSLLKQT